MQQLMLFDDPPPAAPVPRLPAATAPADLLGYDDYIVFFSGGKDSIACVIALLEAGVPPERIELWHHDIDGREGSRLMDWACTAAYCRAFAAAFDMRLYTSWKVGGFERELLRNDQATAPTAFETPDGTVQYAGGESPQRSTRRRFPQVSADLKVRWCSAYLKIDVAARAICNQARFVGKRTLVVSGERAEESPGRATYCRFEPHRTDPRAGKQRATAAAASVPAPQRPPRRMKPKPQRHIDHWRPIHAWTEAALWAALERWRVSPHPCYRLGWGRCSCAGCIFLSPDGWHSLRQVNPAQFNAIAAYEQTFGTTIRRTESIGAAADRGTPYAAINAADRAAAVSTTFDEPIILPADVVWQVPAGAFGDRTGPS